MSETGRTLDLSRFPLQRSGVRGEFRAVQAELLPHSGECVTIAVVAKFGEVWHAAPVPNLERFDCIYGSSALLLREAADDLVATISSLGNTTYKELDRISLPLCNLQWSEWSRSITGNDAPDALRAALGQSSLLAAFGTLSEQLRPVAEQVSVDEGQPTRTRRLSSLNRAQLNKEVLLGLDRSAPTLSSFMRGRRQGASLDSPDFIGSRSAAEFSVLRHQRLKGDLQDVQASLWRLDAYRSGQRNAVAFVYTDAPTDQGEYGEVLNRVSSQAQGRNLKLLPKDESDAMVSSLLELEMA